MLFNAFIEACRDGKLEEVKRIHKYFEVDGLNSAALVFSIANGHLNVVKYLIEDLNANFDFLKGANANVVTGSSEMADYLQTHLRVKVTLNKLSELPEVKKTKKINM